MSWLTKIFGGGNPVAAIVVDTAKGVSDIVERWAPSDAAKHGMTQEVNKLLNESTTAARAYDPRTVGTGRYAEVINVTIDGINRLIRPGMTILIIGAVFGWWPVETKTIDPIVLAWAEAIGAFWFGMRSVTRDIPSLIKMLVELKRGK